MNWLSSRISSVAENTLKGVIAPTTPPKKESKYSHKELGITDELITFIDDIAREHPETFLAFPPQEIDTKDNLDGWEIAHADAMLRTVESLAELRFKLCPSKLNDAKFWAIYFAIVKKKLQRPTISTSEKQETISDLLMNSAFSSPNSKGSDLEEYYDSMFKDQMNNSFQGDEGIDPTIDNYFYIGEEFREESPTENDMFYDFTKTT
eukprot:TRINITY_DN1549_c0_g1_i1.p1 TRINITY_DN1549_c0_g1~~TRINITY_DN1549_c0_g1_i1.p1  ORF type:complete len:207 (+),score=37.01 TRINITY_DN1549_c0_g1_i1:135-755(+)